MLEKKGGKEEIFTELGEKYHFGKRGGGSINYLDNIHPCGVFEFCFKHNKFPFLPYTSTFNTLDSLIGQRLFHKIFRLVNCYQNNYGNLWKLMI